MECVHTQSSAPVLVYAPIQQLEVDGVRAFMLLNFARREQILNYMHIINGE